MTVADDLSFLEGHVNDLEQSFNSRIYELEKKVEELERGLYSLRSYEVIRIEDDLNQKIDSVTKSVSDLGSEVSGHTRKISELEYR